MARLWFYPSKVYNGKKDFPYIPENITGRVMLNPKYKIKHIQPGTLAIVDSGAFQDIDDAIRLTPQAALERQLKYRDYLQTLDPNFNYEAVCIYDQMAGVDEAVVIDVDGKRRKVKLRGTEETALNAIAETLHAAEYYSRQRDRINSRVVWIAQGINPKQYTEQCTIPLMDFAQRGDYFGFGGFCIIGKQRKRMLPVFYETVEMVLPVLQKKGIRRAHLLGVCLPEAVTYFAERCSTFGIVASTDSSAPEVAAVAFGKMYRGGRQVSPEQMKYRFGSWEKWTDYHPIKLAHANVRSYEMWSASL